jgi:hypothetical protein
MMIFSLEMCHIYVVTKARGRRDEGSESGLIPISMRKVLPKAPSTNHSTERSVDPRFYTENWRRRGPLATRECVERYP